MKINCDDTIILKNDRVKLSPLSVEHHDALLPIAIESPELLQYSPSPFGNSEKLMEYIEDALRSLSKALRYPFVIFDKEKEEFIGSSSYGAISNHDQRLEIGWTWLRKSSQGTGINKQLKFLMLEYAFERLKFERVEFKTDLRNLQSQKALEKIGAKREGVLRSHTLMLDGHRRDTVCYSILKGEWESDVKSRLS